MYSQGNYDDLRSVVDLIDSMIDRRNHSGTAPWTSHVAQEYDPHCPTCGAKWPWSWQRTTPPNPDCETCKAHCVPTHGDDMEHPWRGLVTTLTLQDEARPRKSDMANVWRLATTMQEYVASFPNLTPLLRPSSPPGSDPAGSATTTNAEVAVTPIGRPIVRQASWCLAAVLVTGGAMTQSLVAFASAFAAAAASIAIAFAIERRSRTSPTPRVSPLAPATTGPPASPSPALLDAIDRWNAAVASLTDEREGLLKAYETLPADLGLIWQDAYLNQREHVFENDTQKLLALLSMYRIADSGVNYSEVVQLQQCGFNTAADVTIETLTAVSSWLPQSSRSALCRWRDRAATREREHLKDDWWRCDARQRIATHVAILTERTRALARFHNKLVRGRDSVASILSQRFRFQ